MDESTLDFSTRDPLTGVDARLWRRWSPRAFKPEPISDDDLQIIFDAARWSMSSSNEQPWSFHTADCDSPRFAAFLELLNDANRIWAQHASLVGFILSRKKFEKNGSANPWARFDCGAAWMAMTLQANALGYHCHGMGGVKLDVVCQALHLDPEVHDPICGFVIGRRDDPQTLPPALQKREHPSPRKPLAEIWFPR